MKISLDEWNVRVDISPGQGSVPLLLVNGFGAKLESFNPLVKSLGDVEIIRFDIPGIHGSTPPKPYSFSSVAKRMCLLLDKLGYTQVDVLGYSWGGIAAQEFAHLYPERCRKLILAGTSMGGVVFPPRISAVCEKTKAVLGIPRKDIVKSAVRTYGGDPEIIRETLASVGKYANVSSHYTQLLPLIGWTSLPWAWLLPMPILIMAGTRDRLVPLANARFMSVILFQAEFQTFDCGHLFMLTKADEVAQSITDFRERNEG